MRTGSTNVGESFIYYRRSIPEFECVEFGCWDRLDMGVSESVGSLAGSGKVSSSVSGSVLLTAGGR
jgi:hypothetical protein